MVKTESMTCGRCFRFVEQGKVVGQDGEEHGYGFVNPYSCWTAAGDKSGPGGTVWAARMCTDETIFLARDDIEKNE